VVEDGIVRLLGVMGELSQCTGRGTSLARGIREILGKMLSGEGKKTLAAGGLLLPFPWLDSYRWQG